MTAIQIAKDVLKAGHSNWRKLMPDERETAQLWSGGFAERMRTYVDTAYPAQSIANDAAMYQVLQDLSCTYCDEKYPIENLSLCFAAWAFARRALTGKALDPYDSVARVSLLIREVKEGAYDDDDVLAALRIIREDLLAVIPLPSAQAAE